MEPYGTVPYGTIWYIIVPVPLMVPYGTTWYHMDHMGPNGTIWYHMITYGTEQSGYQDDGAKNGSDFFQRFGHKIGPKAFPDVVLVPLDRKIRPGSF